MLLFHTPTSPFVRKVMVVAHEIGAPLETTFLRPTPLHADPTLSKENPLNKIPVLVTPDGPLFDSRVICEYLDQKNQVLPANGAARFRALRLQAQCDGILDAAVLVFYERTTRPAELHYEPWLRGQTEKANQALDALELECGSFSETALLAQICVGITLGWLEFRKPIGDVRANRPKLFGWYDAFRQRPSMKATEPHT
ncbi:MAG TPA: glutathione S-transferase [Polyangiaceae bacterium]|jgi:glutathione S-transferase|nr:glutathione S-transferase [Polyangiaceae bacterium]